jgi:hypothetical protein
VWLLLCLVVIDACLSEEVCKSFCVPGGVIVLDEIVYSSMNGCAELIPE